VLHIFSNTFGQANDSTIELPVVGAAEKANALASGPEERGNISLSCWSTTGCMAAITIHFDVGGEFQHDAFELLRFDGQHWIPLPSPHIDLSASKYGTEVDQISCTSGGWCAVAGHGIDSMGFSLRAWSAVPSGAAWSARVEPGLQSYDGLSCGVAAPCHALAETATGNALVTLATDGSTTARELPRGFSFSSFSCSSQHCAFGGASDNTGGYLGTQSAAAPATTRADPNDKPLVLGNPDTVACTTSSFCVAVGGYELDPVTGASAPLVEIFSNNSWKATAPALPTGIQRGTLNGVACETPLHCVATGQSNGTVSP
jgi:hypothetical protein